MIEFLTSLLTKFFMGGFAALKTKPTAAEHQPAAVQSALESIMISLENGDIELPDPSRVISPFESHVSLFINDETEKTKSGFIEALGSSLDSMGEEIVSHVPESKVISKVDRDEKDGIEVILGSLDWQVDKQSPLVYSIYMDLLKDGFVYRADSKTFVITARVIK